MRPGFKPTFHPTFHLVRRLVIADVGLRAVRFSVRGQKKPRSPVSLIRGATIISILVVFLVILQVLVPSIVGLPPQPAHGLRAAVKSPAGPPSPARVGSAAQGAHPSNSSPSLAGIWQADDGLVFNLTQSSPSSVASSVLNDTCTGGNRTQFITGTIQNNTTISGTMYRCSPSNSLLDKNCGLDAIWSTPFNGTVAQNRINGTSQGQFWNWTVQANGTWTNCHIEYYTNDTFSITRMDCGLMSFAQLAEQYIAKPALRAPDVALATQLAGGTTVVWSAAQMVPWGLKLKVKNFQDDLSHVWQISTSLISAYRPITYQAHFWDIQRCALQMYHTVQATPMVAKYIGTSITPLNQLVLNTFGVNNTDVRKAANLTFDIPRFVCGPPFTGCGHTNGLAFDMKVTSPGGNLVTVDSVGALFGLCRTLPVGDPHHWEYVNETPWGSPKCSMAGTGPGSTNASDDLDIEGTGGSGGTQLAPASTTGAALNSPVNLLVTSPTGQKIGFDPATGSVVNDFPYGTASYSGAGTEPQVFRISANATETGSYSVSGVGIGSGPYSITYSVVDATDTSIGGDTGVVYTESQTGMASPGTAITPVQFPLKPDYSPPSPWTVGTPSSAGAGSTAYTVVTPNGSFTAQANSSTVDALMFSSGGQAIALKPSGAGGPTSVTIPHALLLGPYTVGADGSVLPSTTSNSGAFSIVSFDMPTNATVVTIEGTVPSASGTVGASSFPWLVVGLIAIGVVAVVAIGVAILIRHRRAASPPAPPPPPSLPPPPPPTG